MGNLFKIKMLELFELDPTEDFFKEGIVGIYIEDWDLSLKTSDIILIRITNFILRKMVYISITIKIIDVLKKFLYLISVLEIKISGRG